MDGDPPRGRSADGADSRGRETEESLLRAMRRLQHLDDPERNVRYREWLAQAAPPTLGALSERDRRLLRMLVCGCRRLVAPGHARRARRSDLGHRAVVDELGQLLEVADASIGGRDPSAAAGDESPLAVHARYSTQEIVAALRPDRVAPDKPQTPQAGVIWEADARADVFFVTLQKSERDYSPTTRYRGLRHQRELFHWESQSVQHDGLETVQRYINHAALGTRVLLFVRATKTTRRHHPAVHLPRASRLRQPPGRPAGAVHVAPAAAHARGTLRGGARVAA